MKTFYATTPDGKASKDRLSLLDGVYFHGTVDRDGLDDLVYKSLEDLVHETEISTVQKDEIVPAVVIYPDGTWKDALAFLWKAPAKYELKASPASKETRPVLVQPSKSRGLIVAADDEEGKEYALEAFNKRIDYL